MSERIHFFATREDLLEIVKKAESKRSLQYIPMGLFEMPNPQLITSGTALPGLGTVLVGDMNHVDRYLVALKEARIQERSVPQRSGGVRYALDQLVNPGTIEFTPGGIFQDIAIISGRIATVHQDQDASDLFNSFANGIRKMFQSVKAYRVGSQASELWKKGYRLTASVRSPRDYDLAV